MKRIIIALFFLAGTLGFSNANAQQKVTAKKSTKTMVAKSKDSTVKKPGLKKDGTKDMRFKENKTTKAATTTGPKKKDGTADMRYKANKKK